MSGFKDKTYCASPNCQNKCGKGMSIEEKERLKELAYRGIKISTMVSYAYFCNDIEESQILAHPFIPDGSDIKCEMPIKID